jgi:hypothetical protein
MTCARVPGVLVHELAGVRDETDVQGVGDVRRRLDAEAAHEVPDDLRRARRLGDDVVDDRGEPRVVVVVVDVDRAHRARAQRGRRVAVDVAAVEEDDQAVLDVGRQRGDEAGEVEAAVLVGQRELVGRDEHHRVLADQPQRALHGDERAEGVAVGVLVRDQEEPGLLADDVEHLLARRRVGARVSRHRAAAPCA